MLSFIFNFCQFEKKKKYFPLTLFHFLNFFMKSYLCSLKIFSLKTYVCYIFLLTFIFYEIDLQEFLIFPGKECERYNFCKIRCNYFQLYFKLCVIKRKPYPIESELMARGQHQGGGGVGWWWRKLSSLWPVPRQNKPTPSNKLLKSRTLLMLPLVYWWRPQVGESGLPPQRAIQKGSWEKQGWPEGRPCGGPGGSPCLCSWGTFGDGQTKLCILSLLCDAWLRTENQTQKRLCNLRNGLFPLSQSSIEA